jgi:ribonucleotide reductase beta subunit family protein with ferritin-like domain
MITDKQEAYVIAYPQAEQFAEMQEDIFWTSKEIGMDKDLHDLHNNLTEAEMHGVVTVLKLFTLYETHVGNDYWLDFIRKKFQRPEIQRMASVFGMFELNVHAPFYNKINEVLNLNTEEFYTSYVKDKTLRGRMDWLDRQFDGDDMLASLAVGSIVEGAVLYSNFAFLKHFQAEGKNKLVNMAAGINFSVRDENLHSLAGAWLFNTLREESGQLDNKELDKKIYKTCGKIYEHESRIIDMIFDKGEIRGITDLQMKNFIQARLNLCLEQLKLDPLYEVEYDPISKWFYKNINTPQLHDFFHKQGNSYNRDWQETRFAW